jgi:hypothetical protein
MNSKPLMKAGGKRSSVTARRAADAPSAPGNRNPERGQNGGAVLPGAEDDVPNEKAGLVGPRPCRVPSMHAGGAETERLQQLL